MEFLRDSILCNKTAVDDGDIVTLIENSRNKPNIKNQADKVM